MVSTGHSIEDDHISAIDVVQLVGELVDEDAISRAQSRLHARSVDVVLLKKERTDQERGADCNRNHENPLAHDPKGMTPICLSSRVFVVGFEVVRAHAETTVPRSRG